MTEVLQFIFASAWRYWGVTLWLLLLYGTLTDTAQAFTGKWRERR